MVLFAVQFLSVVLLADCASPAIAERDILLNEAERLGIAFQLQKPREVLSKEQTEMSLVERMIDAAYEKWLRSKASAPSRTTAERSNR